MRPDQFAELMTKELIANACKGDWETWVPDRKQGLGELGYHVAKLCHAIGAGRKRKVAEYAADVGNIAMKLAETFGPESLR